MFETPEKVAKELGFPYARDRIKNNGFYCKLEKIVPEPEPHTRESTRAFTQKILNDIEQMKDRQQKIKAFSYIPVEDFEFNWDVVTDPEEVLSEDGPGASHLKSFYNDFEKLIRSNFIPIYYIFRLQIEFGSSSGETLEFGHFCDLFDETFSIAKRWQFIAPRASVGLNTTKK